MADEKEYGRAVVEDYDVKIPPRETPKSAADKLAAALRKWAKRYVAAAD